jgi:hypothetical protein
MTGVVDFGLKTKRGLDRATDQTRRLWLLGLWHVGMPSKKDKEEVSEVGGVKLGVVGLGVGLG